MFSLSLEAELDALVTAVTAFTDGASIEILQQLFAHIPRRSLQRRLARLVQSERLHAHGNGPARRYLALANAADNLPAVATIKSAEAPWPLSNDADLLRASVTRPLAQRKPVGYRRAFVDNYRPNDTFYLGQTLRDHLHAIGHSPGGVQPAGTYARQVIDRLLVDLSWASSQLEGNTYSRMETQNLIEFGHVADGRDRLETQMILNHKAAIDMLVSQVEEIGFNRYTVQNLHALLAENLLSRAGAGGRLRRIDVAISGTVYQPTAMPQSIEACFDVLLAKAQAIDDPFEQAFFVMVQLPYLQPFEDVNKRVSRLAANIPLIKRNLAPLSFVDVPQDLYVNGSLAVYELNRVELLRELFVWAYERSCQRYTLIKQALPEPDPLRLRYRDALSQVVAALVRGGMAADARVIRAMARAHVKATDENAFVAMVINELHQLHEGNIARFGLRPGDLQQWQKNDPLERGTE